MRKWIVAAAAVFLLAVGWFFASPWIAMASLRDAAREGDLATLQEKIDFPALRQSVKAELIRQINGAEAPADFVDLLVETTITPEGMAGLLSSGSLVPQRSVHEPEEVDWHVDREGLSTFRAEPKGDNSQNRPTLIFHRDGISWSLVGLEIPENDVVGG